MYCTSRYVWPYWLHEWVSAEQQYSSQISHMHSNWLACAPVCVCSVSDILRHRQTNVAAGWEACLVRPTTHNALQCVFMNVSCLCLGVALYVTPTISSLHTKVLGTKGGTHTTQPDFPLSNLILLMCVDFKLHYYCYFLFIRFIMYTLKPSKTICLCLLFKLVFYFEVIIYRFFYFLCSALGVAFVVLSRAT